jgi:hypothetical protein
MLAYKEKYPAYEEDIMLIKKLYAQLDTMDSFSPSILANNLKKVLEEIDLAEEQR